LKTRAEEEASALKSLMRMFGLTGNPTASNLLASLPISKKR
jgi:hypothetical protein